MDHLLGLDSSRSDSWAGVKFSIRVSMEESPVWDLRWSGEMAPMSLPLLAPLCQRICMNVLLREERNKISQRFLGMYLSVLPGFMIGTHSACFHACR